jgi:predicted RNA-binding Zn-ribbon protein involved in translation (DUF1610 family)
MMEMRCAACGAEQLHNHIRCEQCGEPLVFPASELKAWRERAEARRDPRQRALFPASDDASFVCPRCGAESHNPNDIVNRYCGRCHRFTDDRP